MAHRTINGMQARRLATYGLTAGIVLSVSAVSLWALQIPGIDKLPEKPVPVATAPAPETQAQKPAADKVDSDTVAATGDRLDLAVVHAPKPVAKAETPIEKPVETEGPEWTYLGAIHESTRSLAMLRIGDQQKILAEGKSFGDTKLVSIADDKITVEVKGSPKTIERGQRDPTKAVAWVRNMQNSAPPAGAGQPNSVAGVQQPGARGNLPPEVQARLAQRGMSPDQIQTFRQGRNGGPNGNGGPGGGNNGRGRNNFNGGNVNAPGDQTRQRAVPFPPVSIGDSAADSSDVRRAN